MEFLKPNAQRARNVIIIMWINAIVMLLDIFASLFQISIFTQIRDDADYSSARIRMHDLFQQIWHIGILLLTVITIIVFIQWFRRAYCNLHTQMNGLSYSEGWAAGYWFIPIANLYQPYKIMKELFTATDTLLENRDEHYTPQYPRNLLIFWWMTWIIGSIINNFAARSSWSADSIEEFINIAKAEMLASFILAISAFLVIRVIKRYHAMEEKISELDSEASQDLSRHLAGDEQLS